MVHANCSNVLSCEVLRDKKKTSGPYDLNASLSPTEALISAASCCSNCWQTTLSKLKIVFYSFFLLLSWGTNLKFSKTLNLLQLYFHCCYTAMSIISTSLPTSLSFHFSSLSLFFVHHLVPPWRSILLSAPFQIRTLIPQGLSVAHRGFT